MSIEFSRDDVSRFARWSGDCNPLHVDEAFARQTHFGRPIVHGVLTVLQALRSAPEAVSAEMLRSLDLEFRGAVLAGASYEVQIEPTEAALTFTLLPAASQGEADAQPVLVARAEYGNSATASASLDDTSWIDAARSRSPRKSAAPRSIEDFEHGVEITGCYPASVEPWTGSGLTSLHARVLGLCSYVVGMEAPGLRSLFTRLTIQFHASEYDGTVDLVYRLRSVRFDRAFRLLDSELEVAGGSGQLLATAAIRAYMPFSPASTDPAALANMLGKDASSLDGKVVLVIGGTQGLGAEIAAAAALSGAHVYVGGRHDDASRAHLHEALAAQGSSIVFLQGDAVDPAWCQAAAETIRANQGRLDALVLNACARPEAARFGSPAGKQRTYVADNVRLVETPLATFTDLLDRTAGTIAYISSTYVNQPPAGFGPYVAVKVAGEALVRAASETSSASAVIVRPPELQTRWNDTPSAVLSSIPPARAAIHIVRALAASRDNKVTLLTEFPPIVAVAPPTAPEFTLRLAASFTSDPMIPAARFWLNELQLNAVVETTPYAQVLQALLDPASALNARARGFNAVFLRVSDSLRELPDEQGNDPDHAALHLQRVARDLDAAFRAHRNQAASDTLVVFCPSDPALPRTLATLVAATQAQLAKSLQGVAGLALVAAADYHAAYRIDANQIHDPLRDEIGHIPYTDEYLFTLATIAVRHAFRRIAPVRKVVAVDCDNTLWRGVVGEVGAEGIEIDEGHRALHRALVRLAQSGVLVCLCSKNEEPDVWRAFDTRDDFLLRREHVVAAMVNWLPKSQNLRTLAGRLNLGLDSFVFLDDNPVECAEVRAGCPEVLTIEWPQDAGDAVRLLEHLWEFDAREGTKEDARRTRMYQEEFKRQDLSATLTFQDFLANLALEIDFASPAEDEIKRAAQLTLRTNQFNFTTIRREESDLRALIAGGKHEIRTIKVRDRFGDYGLVGLIIAERGETVWTLDTFLLSCRVLGRGVEHHLAAELGRIAGEAGARTVRLRVEPTKRNTPARAFLQSIVPSEILNGLEGDVPVATLAAVKFDPSSGPIEIPADTPTSTVPPQSAERLRRREEQIARTASRLSTAANLRVAITGIERPVSASLPDQDIASVVGAAFATALRTPAKRIADVDRLDALGCDSMRIVEITVALREKFPWLPPTLLFEHRSVSAIIAEISALANKGRSTPVVETAPPVVARKAQQRSGDIAVVGMHVRCAGASSPDELWQLLSQRRSAVHPVPANRPQFLRPLHDTRHHWAGLLDDVARFDAELFGISPREAEFMDPQTRLFLEVAWSALEDAGCLGANHDAATGVFAGVMYADYGVFANQDPAQHNNAYRCWEGFSLANRLSQLLGYGGPSLAVDTACSSSATAVHLACASLNAGDCPVAVVGGVNLILDPDRFASLGRLGILSERGQCEPFGANADGTVLGEGAGVVVLRPLEDALRRGDRIYGVIKGTGISTGNGTVGFTAPNPQAQAEAIRRSLTRAGIDPRTVSYIETHGTGTGLGDPIEVRGLTLGYDHPELHDSSLSVPQYCRMGSIKPNIGHLEAGAGIMGLIKVLLQMQRGMLLPSITSSEPSPAIAFAKGTFEVQRELEPWQRRTTTIHGRETSIPRRAGLSSFGVGGANAHVIIEEPPDIPAPAAHVSDRPAHLLALSARSADALERQADTMRSFIESTDAPLADVAFTLNSTRRHFEHRLAIPFSTREELLQGLKGDRSTVVSRRGIRGTAGSSRPKIAFLFTGQGSQYAGMGRALYSAHPVFRDALDRCAEVFRHHLDRTLLDVLFATEGTADAELINQTGYTQPALFSFEYAMSVLWQSWGIRPDIVMGHSVGEIAAMCVAGGVSLEDGLKLIAARGRLMQALPPGGTMTSVMADESRVLEALEGEEELVAIAAINAPAQVVISGAGTAVAAVTARLEAAGVKAKALTVSHAFHSPLMKPMLAEYERVVREVRFTVPRIPLVSGVTATICGDEVTRPEYWLRNVMDPVRFASGMRSLEAAQVTAYVEVGPHPVLTGMGRQCVEDEAAATWLPSVKKDSDAWQTLLASAARLHVQGASFDWKAFDAPFQRKRVAVPAYAHGGRQFWLKSLKGPTPASSAKSAVTPANVAAPAATSGPSMYELLWRKQAPAASAVETRHWVLLADRTGVAGQLERALVTEGARVTTAVVGPEFSESAGTFTLDPLSRDQVSQFVERVSARDQGALRFVYFWGLDANASTMPADKILTGAAHLVQALAARQIAGRSLWVVTRDAIVVEASANTPPVSVDQAALWGFGRTVALEHPELWGGIVDIDGKDPAGLARELAGNGIEDQVALRSGNCYVPRLVRRREPTASRRTFNAEGTYLVTGGTGALGLHLAEWLVDRGARRLVLASRRAALLPEARNRLQALEQRGVNVTVFQADVSIAADVDALLAPIKTGPTRLRGIVHAAGVDVPLGLDALDNHAIGDVLAAKLTGTRLLHERTRDLGLDLFVGVSSVSSVLGAQSRAHYAAANASLDGVLAERRRLGLPAVGVNWGPWREGGMATDAHLQQFERIGNRGLPPARAIEALDRLASEGSAQTTVIDIDWDRFGPVYESRRSRPLIAEAIQTTSADVSALATPAATGWIERLQRLPVSERRQELEVMLQGEIAETLGFDSGAAVPLERNFYDLGMDSLLMADLVGRLKAHLGVPCSSLVFEHPHITALSVALLERLPLDTLASTQPSASLPAKGGPSYDTISQLPAANRLEALTILLRQEVSAALGFDSTDAVRPDQRFTDLGMDSLLSAELASRLKRLGVKSASVVFEYPTVDSLAAHLVQQLPSEEHSVASATREPSALPEDEILEFQHTAFPTRTESLVAPRWRWMFVESAQRLGVQPRFWVHRDDGKIVAQMGSIPVRLKVGTDHLDTGWLVETMVREEYRNKAIGSRLMVEAHEEQPFSLSLGQTAEMREIQYRLGWKNVAPLQTAQALVRARNVFKAKLPSALGWAAGATIDSSSALARRLRPRRRFTVRSIDRFDERHDRLWDRVAPEYTTAVVRDASYLNWKYVDQPGQDLMRLEFSDKGEVVAVAIWTLREPDGIYGYRRALLYDLVTPLFNPALLREVIANACVPALDAGADALVCLHISTRLTAALRACGFAIRQPTRHLLVDPGPLSGRTRDGVLASDAWFVTQGDSDIDRPW